MSVLLALPLTGYFAIQNSKIQTILTQRIATILSNRLHAKISVGHVNIRFFRSVHLEDILIEDQKNDTLLFAKNVSARIDTIRFRKRFLSIDELNFSGNQLNLSRDSDDIYNFSFLLDALDDSTKTSEESWFFRCKTFHFNTLRVKYTDNITVKHKILLVDDLNMDITNFKSQNDFTTFQINQLKLNSNQNIQLKNLSANVSLTPQKIELTNWSFESRSSQISNASFTLNLASVSDTVSTPLQIDLQIPESRLNFLELGQIIPALKGMDQVVQLSGQIYGDINDLKGKNIRYRTGQDTQGDIDFYINDLLNPEKMYLFVDVKESSTSFNDLSNIRLPNSAKLNYLQFPGSFYQAGILHFKGNFSGFLDDFVTFGTLQSKVGTLTTDILVAPEKEGSVYYRGNIATSNFQLGKLFKEENLGKLTFNGSVDGKYNQHNESVSGIFKGKIKTVEINDYPYNDIEFDGILVDKMFDGLLVMNDSNLQFSFLGQVDLNTPIPEFNFTLQLNKARPAPLNLFKQFPKAEISFNMNANFKGATLDNLDGTINVKEGYYKNRNGSFDLGGMTLKTNKKNGVDSLSFKSDFMDIDIGGNYHFRSIADAIQQTINRFIPSYKTKEPENNGFGNKFDFNLNVKDINPLANIFAPGLEMDTPFLLYGNFDSNKKEIDLEGSIPGVRYKGILARDIFIGNKAIDESYFSKFRFGEIRVNNDIQLYNFRIDSEIANDVLNNSISWSNYDELTYSGSIKTRTLFSKSNSTDNLKMVIEGQSSKIFIADTVWNISPFTVTLDSSSISINNFLVYNRNQQIAIDGRTHEGHPDLLNLYLKNINLADLNVYTKQDLEISGMVNGTVGFANLFDKPAILADLSINNFYYQDQLMGDVSLVTQWNSNQSKIDSRLKVMRNGRLSLDAFGSYLPSIKGLDFDARFDSVSLIVLETFMGESFSDFKGYGSGKVNIGGTVDKILLNGALMGENAGVTITATQVPYMFNDSVYFRNDTILFDNLTVFDSQKNQGKFFGTIVHENFGNMIYDLHATTNQIKALNTTLRDNEKFYGVAIARGRLNITGKGQTVRLTGSMTSLAGTEVNISMESESEVEKYDFIEFVVPNETEEPDFYKQPEDESKISLSLSVEATSDAKVQLIYNSQIGDVIKAQGEGLLVFDMNEDGDIFLSGNYKPTRGDYLFTLQNVINKRFTIEPGGSIAWSGDPYNADIDLKAIYKLKASLYDLFMNSATNTAQNQRIQVECIIHLKDELANPTISFQINFPNAEEITKDNLQQFFNTEEEMNKQILSLIVMGKFYTPEYLRGTYEAQNTNMLGTTASELFSNQLSNWLSQINDHWDVGVNYRPGTQVSDDEIELALSTQIFNDRVTLNGNIGNNANQYSTNNSQIVGDFEINVKLVPSGKIQLKAYSRSNNNLFYETAPYTQGIGLSFTEEYNTINDLYRKLMSIFRKKK